ncbi:MAG: hypothetical protein PHW04_01420 [Candidatus Wallbacteria bacterium]|nr:hypothetical protein [Candidatus Wallbacteria bacterium]
MKRLFLAAVLTAIFPACADFGSVDLALLLRFHPYNIFFYLPENDGFITAKFLKNNEFSIQNLVYLHSDMVTDVERMGAQALQQIKGLEKENKLLESKNLELFERYRRDQAASGSKASTETEKGYLLEREKNREQISKNIGKIDTLTVKLGSFYLAGKDEQDKLRKQIKDDVLAALTRLKKSCKLEKLIFYPGAPSRAENCYKFPILELCNPDKDNFNDQERGKFNNFMKYGFYFRQNFLAGRENFILCGGADYTWEAVRILFEKYKVSSELQEILINTFKQEESR